MQRLRIIALASLMELCVGSPGWCDSASSRPSASASIATSTYVAPTLELVGPMVSPVGGPSTYFDGNLSSVLNPPRRFEDQLNNYYYHSAETSGWCCSGYFGFRTCLSLGCFFGCGGLGGFFGPQVVGTPVNVSGW